MDIYGIMMAENDNRSKMDFRSVVPNFIQTNGLFRPQRGYFKHAHPWWEIVFYLEGEGSFITDQEVIEFSPGTVICTPPGIEHREAAKHTFRNRWVAVEHLEASERIPTLVIPMEHPVFDLLDILYTECSLDHTGSDIIIRNVFECFMIYLNDWLASDPHHQLVVQLQRKLIAGMGDPAFRVGDAMDEMPISRDHLRRLFKGEVGASPKDYLTNLRMSRAKELLASGMRVKAVADLTGFGTPYHFSRMFSRNEGTSPSSYAEARQE